MESETGKRDVKERTFLGGIRSVLLVGVGALALGADEVEAVVRKLVERGELAEDEGRDLVKDILERRKRVVETSTEHLSEEVEKRMESVLQRMNLPSRADIDALKQQVAELSNRVETLREAQEHTQDES